MLVIPISGGPHTGKTRLNRELQQAFPGAIFIPEPATRVIERELALQERDTSHTPNVPWIDYRKFAPVVLAESVALEADIPESANLVFTDRCRIDTKAYCRLNNYTEFVPLKLNDRLPPQTTLLLCFANRLAITAKPAIGAKPKTKPG